MFASHPDDETFGCGGTIAKKQSENFDVLILVTTDSKNLFRNLLGIEHNPSPTEVCQTRKLEVLRAVKVLGVPTNNVYISGL